MRILHTGLGVSVAVWAHRVGDCIEAGVDAVDSPRLRELSGQYGVDLRTYLQRGSEVGVARAGEPPKDGAHQLNEVEATCTPSEGNPIRYTGGTGTEWQIRWVWRLSSGVDALVTVKSSLGTVAVPVARTDTRDR